VQHRKKYFQWKKASMTTPKYQGDRIELAESDDGRLYLVEPERESKPGRMSCQDERLSFLLLAWPELLAPTRGVVFHEVWRHTVRKKHIWEIDRPKYQDQGKVEEMYKRTETEDNSEEFENLNDLQKLLNQAFMEFVTKTKRRQASDNDFARWLEVTPSSLSQWINGNKKPDLNNAIKLARKLGPSLFDALGYPRMIDTIGNPELRYIIDNWHLLTTETQEWIFEHVQENLQ